MALTTAPPGTVDDPAPPLLVSRDEFLRARWRWRPGEHITLLGPTKSGKTTLALQLLAHTASVAEPAVMLVMKPRDPVIATWAKAHRWEIIRTWPPTPRLWGRRPAGWVLWPKPTYDPDRDDEIMQSQFRRAIRDCYRTGHKIVFADELMGLCEDLHLERDVVRVFTRGRTQPCAMCAATQRPAWVPQAAYTESEHLFLAHNPDRRARQRYGEIGGIDGRFIERVTMSLRRHQWFYLRREDYRYCIVDA